MLLPPLAARQVHPANISSTLSVVHAVSTRLASVLSSSHRGVAHRLEGSAAAADASNLASIATDSYDGLSFVQLGAAFSTALVVVLVVSCFAAFFLRQAGQMRRLMEVTDEEELSDVGLGDGGTRVGGRTGRGARKGERRGLIAGQY
ncbi:hypothetical protein JCM8208_005153 [Rhodotorula glutinis]